MESQSHHRISCFLQCGHVFIINSIIIESQINKYAIFSVSTHSCNGFALYWNNPFTFFARALRHKLFEPISKASQPG